MANPPLHAVPALLAEDPAVVAAATAEIGRAHV